MYIASINTELHRGVLLMESKMFQVYFQDPQIHPIWSHGLVYFQFPEVLPNSIVLFWGWLYSSRLCCLAQGFGRLEGGPSQWKVEQKRYWVCEFFPLLPGPLSHGAEGALFAQPSFCCWLLLFIPCQFELQLDVDFPNAVLACTAVSVLLLRSLFLLLPPVCFWSRDRNWFILPFHI